MTTVYFEKGVQKLSHLELATFRKWFYKFDDEEWDIQIEEDVFAGKLDKLAEKSIADYHEGRSKEI